jgi:hypothetical protein
VQYGPVEESAANKTFDESLPHARREAANYSKELERIKEDYCAKNPGDCPGYLIAA